MIKVVYSTKDGLETNATPSPDQDRIRIGDVIKRPFKAVVDHGKRDITSSISVREYRCNKIYKDNGFDIAYYEEI